MGCEVSARRAVVQHTHHKTTGKERTHRAERAAMRPVDENDGPRVRGHEFHDGHLLRLLVEVRPSRDRFEHPGDEHRSRFVLSREEGGSAA